MDPSLLSLAVSAEASARAVFSMFFILLFGFTFAYFKKISHEGLTGVGIAINYIYMPAILFYSFAEGLSLEILQGRAWIIIVLGLITIPISGVLAYPMMMLSQPPRWFRSWYLFGATFQNTIALPLVLIQTICSQVQFIDNSDSHQMTSSECISKSNTYIFLYVFMNELVFWIIAYDIMPVDTSDAKDGRPPVESRNSTDSSTPVVFDSSVVDATTTSPATTTTTLFGGLVTPPPEPMHPNVTFGERFLRRILVLFLQPPILAQLVGTLVGLIRPLQLLLFTPNSVLQPLVTAIKIFADASTAVTNLNMSAGMGLAVFQMTEWKQIFGGSPGMLSVRTTWLFVCTKMILLPAVLFLVIFALNKLGLFPEHDRLALIICYMLVSTPSANTCMVVPQMLGNTRASSAMGLLILAQYLVALPALLVWLSLAFYLSEGV